MGMTLFRAIATLSLAAPLSCSPSPQWSLDDSSAARERLATTKSLKCEFDLGTSAEWKEGQLRVASAKFGLKGEKGVFHFDSIDTEAGTARFIANAGASDVEAILDPVGLTFLEKPGLMGGLVITTVYARDLGDQRFPAVFSKHVAVFGLVPFPQQYYGYCSIWE